MEAGHREKSLMRLYRELDALKKQRRDLGWERLDPPVMRGYKRYFVLRAEVARSREAGLFQGILDRVNTTEYSSRRDFKKKRRRGGKKMYEVRSQELQRLWMSSFKERKFSEKEASYFDLVMTDEKPGSCYRWVYVFREPWRFQLKIEPNIIRWPRVKDFDLERRIGEMERYIDGNHLWPTILRLVKGRYQYWGRFAWCGELEKYRYDPFKNRMFAEVVGEYWEGERAGTMIGKPSDDEGFPLPGIISISECFLSNWNLLLVTSFFSFEIITPYPTCRSPIIDLIPIRRLAVNSFHVSVLVDDADYFVVRNCQ